jgi:pimeloyl-ACP methyl ester carboxylesterase
LEETAQTLRINGLNMYLASAGQGAPVLLLHGFPDSHTVWRKQIKALAEAGYRVIAPDLRGCGRSDAPKAVKAYTLDRLRDDVLALLDALDIDKVRLVGHDWGAVIGWQLCMQAPERVERFVALSAGHPAAFAHAGLEQRLRSCYMLVFRVRGLAERLLTTCNWFFLRLYVKDRTQLGHWRRSFAAPGRLTAALNYYRANKHMAARRNWPPVTVPVLGVWSDGDAALTERQMRDSAAYVTAGFRYERIDGADHWLQLSAPGRINALLLDFLRAGVRT